MARGDFVLFEEFAATLLNGAIAWDLHASDTIKLGIVDNTATVPAAAATAPDWSDFSGNEVGTGGNYVADGLTLTTTTYTEADGVGTFDADDVEDLTQDGSGFTDGYYGILYDSSLVGNNAIGYLDLGGPVSEVAGPIVITWGVAGIFTVTISNP